MTRPPVTPADLIIQKTAFDKAIVDAANGGSLATAIKDAARALVVSSMDKNASYVDIHCQDSLPISLVAVTRQ